MTTVDIKYAIDPLYTVQADPAVWKHAVTQDGDQ